MVVELYVLINDVDIGKYAQSFDEFHLSSVLQFLEAFKWDQEAEDWLRKYIEGIRSTGRVTPPSESYSAFERDQTLGPGTVVGFHEDCGGKIVSYKIKGCHTAATGRLKYEECSKCTYYREEFKGG